MTFTRDIERVKLHEDSKRLNNKTTKNNTVYGIVLSALPDMYARAIKNRRFIRRKSDDDRFLHILFHCLDIEQDRRSFEKIYYLKNLDIFTTENNVDKYDTIYIWDCLDCGKEVHINTNSKIIPSDFLCDKCFNNSIRTPIIRNDIIREFVKFNNFITDKMKNEYDYFNNKMKNNRN